MNSQNSIAIKDSASIESQIVHYCLGAKLSLKFHFENSVLDSFGFYEGEGDFFCPSGLIIIEDYIYLLDNFHRSLKRINVRTREVISSKQFESYTFWITKFNGLIYLSTCNDTIYILDKNMKQLDKVCIEERGRFYGDSEESLKIWFPENNRLVEINKSNKIISDKEFKGYLGKDNYVNGKECIIQNSKIISGDIEIDISNSSFTEMDLKDFSDNIFAYYDISSDMLESFEIFIYEIIEK